MCISGIHACRADLPGLVSWSCGICASRWLVCLASALHEPLGPGLGDTLYFVLSDVISGCTVCTAFLQATRWSGLVVWDSDELSIISASASGSALALAFDADCIVYRVL